jgi:hypothetical protein
MNNKLEGALPEGLGCLDALVSLGLKGNAITALHESLGGCASLIELYVTDNQLQVTTPHCSLPYIFVSIWWVLLQRIASCNRSHARLDVYRMIKLKVLMFFMMPSL